MNYVVNRKQQESSRLVYPFDMRAVLCGYTAVTGPSSLVYADEFSQGQASREFKKLGFYKARKDLVIKSSQLLLKLMTCFLICKPIL